MSEVTPTPTSPVPEPSAVNTGEVDLLDVSLVQKWRLFDGAAAGVLDVIPGTSRRDGDQLVWSVSPGEWTLVGAQPAGDDVVDLTHVRAMFALTGDEAPQILSRLCALELGDDMFPPGAAARTLVAGVATEIVRDDRDARRSYLVLPSRSFGRYLWEAIIDAGGEFGLAWHLDTEAHGARSSRT